MRWKQLLPDWSIDCRYLGPRRDSAWYVLSRRASRRGWRRWLARLLRDEVLT